MRKKYKLFKNFYRDSVTLMQLSAKLGNKEGITLASALMGTPANMQMMINAGLLDSIVSEAAPNDLLLVVKGDELLLDGAVAEFEQMITQGYKASGRSEAKETVSSISEALLECPQASLALISVPGEYAAAEAMKALRRGLNVMIFSDGVSEEQELALKKYATENELLVMGPDCGTAIISGVPLAFANVVAKGGIGIIGASGTGVQEVTSMIDQQGEGISHAIGTGGHDLSAAVGGLTMTSGLMLLIDDPQTEVIVLISKPPAAEVAEKVLSVAMSTSKPVIVCFLGAAEGSISGHNIHMAMTLEAAAKKAIALVRGEPSDFTSLASTDPDVQARAAELKAVLKPAQRYIRGLYSGGTFCYEALLNLQYVLPDLYSNIPTGSVKKLSNNFQSQSNTVIDLGDDDFTRGKPHPMIDPSQRNERLLMDASDPETAVILFDVVIGYGANPDPAGEIASVIAQAQKKAEKEGRKIIFIGFVCGTDKDPQSLSRQRQKLKAVGVHLCHSNAEAVALAGAVMSKYGNEM